MFPPGRIMTTANSQHANLVNMALVDGSTQSLSANIDLVIYRALGTRNGGEIVNLSEIAQ
jgi:hypothetical protein